MRWCAGACFALLAFGLIAPAQALAGCSHYAKQRASWDAIAKQFDPQLVGRAEALDGESPLPDDPRRPTPCSGSSCSGQPAAPVPPAAAAVKFFESWACLSPFRPASTLDSTLSLAASRVLAPRHGGDSIFHPPRRHVAPSIA